VRIATLVACALAALCWPAGAAADLADETALAERYAPVVRLVEQEEECGHGEPYSPLDVDLLFDEPTVSLRGPWAGDLVKIAPLGDDLTRERYEYHLDFPGNALDPGCGYERWARRLTSGKPPAVYAHVATERRRPGKLALQYWLFYAFNDWNNTHEGDWEMMQLVFNARNAAEALARDPAEVGYSQHEGGERADWRDDKLELVDRTHPVVHPAAGSHANFFDEGLHLGRSASEGVGCDDTSGPTFDLRPEVRTIPSDPAAALERFPWIGFEGRWGELQRGIFNGPTGPNVKSQWTKPIEWSEEWRSRSLAVPGGGALGTGATDFFCGAVATGSNALRRAVDEPLQVFVFLLVVVLLIVYLLSRTTWRPSTPLRVARRRAWGQVLSAAAVMYTRRIGLFLGLGVIALPVSVLVTLLQAGLLRGSSFLGIPTEGEGGGLAVYVAVVIGTGLTLTALGLVQAATARALVKIDQDERISPLRAYGLALDSLGSLLVALLLAAFVISLLVSTIFLVPIAIWLAVRWALIAPVVALERRPPLAALRHSGRLVRLGWVKVGSLVVVGAAIALLAGPLLGSLLILLTDTPLVLLNIISGVVYAFALPFVALATVYVYFDMRVREELVDEARPDVLPAEIEVSA
jgi:hypothetical protein